MGRSSRYVLACLLLGALFGLVFFAIEAGLALRAGAIGLHVDVRGTVSELMRAVRPQLPGLFTRVLAFYLACGALLGALAGALALALSRGRFERALRLWPIELCVLFLAWSYWAAVHRPALFDDLPIRPVLGWIVDHGAPWHAPAALTAWLVVHLPFRARLRAGVAAAVGLGLVLAAWVVPDRASLVPHPPGARQAEASRPPSPPAPIASLRSTATGPRARPKLVLLFGIDAFRPDRLEHGRPGQLPNVEALLREATFFTRAYTPIAQTEPAWRSLVTARWPSRTGDRFALDPEAGWARLPTFPAALGRAGVATEFATDCSRFNYLDALSGFSRFHEPPRGALNFLLEKLRFRWVGMAGDDALGAAWLPELTENRALAGLYDPIGYAERLADRVVALTRSGPAVFAFHDTAAHFPGDPVYPFYRRYVPSEEPLERRLRMSFAPVSPGARGGWTRSGSEALYDELLSQADAQLGIVLERLRRAGLYDEAWVIVFSDHGESFYADHPALQGATSEHGAQLSEEENRILLVVKPPRSFGAPPPRIDALVRLIDLGPTVLDAVGVPPLPGADGLSLLPLLRGAPEPPRWLYAETGFTHVEPDALSPGHYSSGPRTLDAYRVLPDGTVELTDAAAAGALREKDVGAFDGEGWLIESPQADGGVSERCVGRCDPTLNAFLARTR